MRFINICAEGFANPSAAHCSLFVLKIDIKNASLPRTRYERDRQGNRRHSPIHDS